jgi:hypothetical protein
MSTCQNWHLPMFKTASYVEVWRSEYPTHSRSFYSQSLCLPMHKIPSYIQNRFFSIYKSEGGITKDLLTTSKDAGYQNHSWLSLKNGLRESSPGRRWTHEWERPESVRTRSISLLEVLWDTVEVDGDTVRSRNCEDEWSWGVSLCMCVTHTHTHTKKKERRG